MGISFERLIKTRETIIFTGILKFSAILLCKYKELKSRTQRFLEKNLLKANSL